MIFWREKYTHQVTTFEILLKAFHGLSDFSPLMEGNKVLSVHPVIPVMDQGVYI